MDPSCCDTGGTPHRRATFAPWALLGLAASVGSPLAQSAFPAAELRPIPRYSAALSHEPSWPAVIEGPAIAVPSVATLPRQSQRISPAQAFNRELREEAIHYRYTNRWAYASEELQGDRPVREGRSRAAEGMLGDAMGAAFEVFLRDAWNMPRRQDTALPHRGVRHQLRVDSSPSWRLRGRAGVSDLRLDLPLSAHSSFALRTSRRMDGPRNERRLGTSIAVNPWDEAVSFGLEWEF